MSHSIEMDASENRGLPQWFDAAAPWMTSIVFHLGIGLLVLFLAWFIVKALPAASDPISFPSGTPIDLTGPVTEYQHTGKNDSPRDPANIKEVMAKDGWAPTDSKEKLTSLLPGTTGNLPPDIISRGKNGGTNGDNGNGLGGERIAPYGIPNGGGLFNIGAAPGAPRAQRVVYLIDHSGSLLDNFDYLRDEVKRCVNNLTFIQEFGVVAFSEDAQILGPSILQHAGENAKRDLASRVDVLKAMGENDGQLLPFQRGFEKAFALKPELIYFLTDGAFDPKLFEVIHRMNTNHAVHINTLAFVNADPRYEVQLKQLAKENGGVYKFVSEKELGK